MVHFFTACFGAFAAWQNACLLPVLRVPLTINGTAIAMRICSVFSKCVAKCTFSVHFIVPSRNPAVNRVSFWKTLKQNTVPESHFQASPAVSSSVLPKCRAVQRSG